MATSEQINKIIRHPKANKLFRKYIKLTYELEIADIENIESLYTAEEMEAVMIDIRNMLTIKFKIPENDVIDVMRIVTMELEKAN